MPHVYASQDQVLMGQTLDLNLHNLDRYTLELAMTNWVAMASPRACWWTSAYAAALPAARVRA